MNILLINASQATVYGTRMIPAYPPLGLLYIAAVLEKEHHNVEVLDFDVDIHKFEDFKNIIKNNTYDLFGISSVTPTINNAFYLAENIKSIKKDIPIILGGIHATILPNECIHNEFIDFVAIGESENTIVEFLHELQKPNPCFSNVRGIAYKINGEVFLNEKRELEQNLNKFPFPARHLLKNPGSYSPPDAERLPAASVFLTRGCFGKCTYCCTKQISGHKMRFRSLSNMMEEIDEIVKLGYKELHILDDNFTANKKKTIELCHEIRKRNYDLNFEISNGLRADMVDYEVLSALKSIGVKNVGFGIESGNEQILKNIKKEISKDTTREAIRLAKELKFEIWAFFIIGLPGETPETVKDTINFAKELNPDFAKFLILKPFPGSEVYNQLFSKDLIHNFDYSNYGVYTAPVHNLETMDSDEILYWQKKAFRDFYFRPRKIVQHILRIKNFTNLKIILRGFLFVVKNIYKPKFRS
ncbi:MAG: B12-binding domain-containing radical SAM protein [Candidatus Aminicenantes bacterium]|nr:B12-binding domain-containing radical SAM protein [Candidatus Aminicenantes bacterium]